MKHPLQLAVAESVVSLTNHTAVFFNQECLVFNTATLEIAKVIKLAGPLTRPVQVGPDHVVGIMTSQRRLTFLNVKTGEIRGLLEVPMEIPATKSESYEWWHFNSVIRFPLSQCFGYCE